jgi:uncharacterized protein (TIGR02145 family)
VAGIWQTVGTNQTYICHDTGFFACMTDGDFCTLYDTIKVMYYPNASVSLGPNRTICEGTTVTLAPGNYQSYEWIDGSTSPEFTTGNEGQVWVRVTNVNGCVAKDTVLISVDSLPFGNQVISGPSPVCQGLLQQLYAVPDIKYATSYEWQIPPGTSGTSLISQILVDFSVTATSGSVAVRGLNSCGPGPFMLLPVVVNPLPAAPGPITSPAQVCQGQPSITLSVPSIPEATGYQWGLPSGFAMTSPPGSSITVNAGTTAQSGTISVYGTNGCGNGPTVSINIQVALLPPQPSAIQGPAVVCQGQSNVIFSVSSLAGADSYIWSFPSGCEITSGSGTGQVVVTIDSTAISGDVTVKGHSDQCGDGPVSELSLTVNPLPSPAGSITGSNPVCQGQSVVGYSITPLANTTSYFWELPTGVFLLNGSGTPTISVSISASAATGLIRVQGVNPTCGAGRKSSQLLTVNPLPLNPGDITGPGSVCQGDVNTLFSIDPGDPATSQYLWSLLPSIAGTINGNQTNITINWSGMFSGQAILQVKGTNGCGEGSVSPQKGITVNYRPTVNFSACFDLNTTKNARQIELTGGRPLGPGGEYSGTGVTMQSNGKWYFQPSSGSVSGSVSGTPYTIKYSYTNVYQCPAEAIQIIRVFPSNANDACPGTVTDVRDGKSYSTFMAGFGVNARCWMAANLDFGEYISLQSPQTDNCVAEKYCRNDQSQQCQQSGGFYQWREMMAYRDVEGSQGICMPGWHVPTEPEWQSMINSVASGVSPPVDGIAGGFLKDTSLTNGFHALPQGIAYHNNNWWFNTEPLSGVFFWTSTPQDGQHMKSRGLTNKNPSVSWYAGSPANAFNLRCVRD